MRTVQSWTCEHGYGADTMFHRTYFLFYMKFLMVFFLIYPYIVNLFEF